ncbi:hypothetical protein NYG93_06010 [Campylobacter felis]|uniref:hypothetical protein n=1 Tax=Campylobacter felis TaxID=2974565 RepID=UPI002564108F|nr:hypothetical protein [Campylobacter felis]MDL0108620.1 hypothetical protein [Campylobacter felis]MDL0109448.1 hypothetical protein [Campylobacter felis]
MGFWSFVGTAISAVSSVCSTLGSFGSSLFKTIGALSPHLKLIVDVVSAVVNSLGIFKKEYTPEDYGAALRQAEKKPEDFDSINAYIDYLSAEMRAGRIDLNKEKSDIDKWADTALGVGLGIKSLDEKFKLQTSTEFWKGMGKKFNEGKIDEKDVESILKNSSQNNINSEDLVRYMQNQPLANGTKPSDISQTLKEALKESKPELTEQEQKDKFNALLRND